MLSWLLACSDYTIEETTKDPPFDPGDSADDDTDEGAPDIDVSPVSYDAGDVEVGALVSTRLTVSNLGDAPLEIDGATTPWTTTFASVTLAPYESTLLEVSTSALVGLHEDSVSIASDDPDEPLVVVPLAYRGLDPCSWEQWKPDDGCDGGWPGTGVDGEVTLASWSPNATTLAAPASGATLDVADENGFAVDDEVFLHDPVAGAWAFARVVGVVPLTLADAVDFPAGTVVQRVPHYTNVRVDETVSGARVVFRACGTVTVEGRLGADGGGWAGGQRTTTIPELGWQGRSEAGGGAQSDAANGTGGGGGSESCNVHTDGGGGGHATDGTQGGDNLPFSCGGTGGLGGGTIGEPTLAALFFGGGGGGGYLDTDATAGSYGGAGGGGGGLVRIVALGFDGGGFVGADGASGEDGHWIGGASPGGGGGGAGGSVWLTGPVAVRLSADGAGGGVGSEAGSGPTNGGTGGEGRIRVDGTLSATTSPEAYEACP